MKFWLTKDAEEWYPYFRFYEIENNKNNTLYEKLVELDDADFYRMRTEIDNAWDKIYYWQNILENLYNTD